MDLIYLDNNATTQLDPRAVEAMLPFLREQYANPSSLYQAAQQVRYAVECAREQVAALLHALPRQIVFTSGGTEGNHLAIRGVLAAQPDKRHVITTAAEHHCTLRLCAQLQREGHEVTYLGVNGQGQLDLSELEAAIKPTTALLSVMHANNETGVIFPIERIGAIARQHGIPLHVDAAQTAGKIPIDVDAAPIDLLSFAAHKLHGPKGIGGLYVRRGIRIRPQLLGGHQEHDLRAGTENVPGIIGFGVAAELAARHLPDELGRVRELRDRLETGILDRVPYARRLPSPPPSKGEGQGEGVRMTPSPSKGEGQGEGDRMTPSPSKGDRTRGEGDDVSPSPFKGEGRGEGDHIPSSPPKSEAQDEANRLPNTTNIAFAGLEAEAILILLSNHGICASSGSACSSGSLEPSHVLTAMGIDRALIHGAIRLSLSRFNTPEEIDRVLDILPPLLKRLEPLAAHSTPPPDRQVL